MSELRFFASNINKLREPRPYSTHLKHTLQPYQQSRYYVRGGQEVDQDLTIGTTPGHGRFPKAFHLEATEFRAGSSPYLECPGLGGSPAPTRQLLPYPSLIFLLKKSLLLESLIYTNSGIKLHLYQLES